MSIRNKNVFSVMALCLIFLGTGCSNTSVKNLESKSSQSEDVIDSTRPDDSIDTAAWQTYTYTEAGFSIKHPSDWTVSIGREGSLYIGNGIGEAHRQLQINIDRDEPGAEEIVDVEQSSVTRIDRVDALQLTHGRILVRGKDMNYWFVLTPNADSTIREMIKTFRFITE